VVFERRGEIDGLAITTALDPRVDLLAWFTVTGAQIPMVIKQSRHSGSSERFGITICNHRDRGRGSVSHYHDEIDRDVPGLGELGAVQEQTVGHEHCIGGDV